MRQAHLVRVLTGQQAATWDRATIDAGTPSRALMQRAGALTAAEIALRFPDALGRGVLVFAGGGNNGGDGWVVARALAATGVRVRVVEVAAASSPDCVAEKLLALPFVETRPGGYEGEGVVVDALLGTGASGAPRGEIAASIAAMRAARERGAIIVAADLPSGVNASTGAINRPARAHLTCTYGSLKRGHLLARAACGRIAVIDIGLGDPPDDKFPSLISGRWVAAQLPALSVDAHKGSRRKIAIVGGGAGMSGAVVLAARAAWRSGVGMVKLVVAEETLASVREAEPQSLTAAWPSDDAAVTRDIAKWADAVILGPGLGTDSRARGVLDRVLAGFTGPVVLDADALNVFSSDVNALQRALTGRAAVLTPHPVEFGRLAGLAVDDVLQRRFDVAAALARHVNAVVLLKGQPTVVTSPDGEVLVSASGTPVLAAAGSGDVLSGMTGTLLAQLGDPLVAAGCAAWVHGRAAFLAQRRAGGSARGLTLADVLARLPRAWSPSSRPSRYPVLIELPDVLPR